MSSTFSHTCKHWTIPRFKPVVQRSYNYWCLGCLGSKWTQQADVQTYIQTDIRTGSCDAQGSRFSLLSQVNRHFWNIVTFKGKKGSSSEKLLLSGDMSNVEFWGPCWITCSFFQLKCWICSIPVSHSIPITKVLWHKMTCYKLRTSKNSIWSQICAEDWASLERQKFVGSCIFRRQRVKLLPYVFCLYLFLHSDIYDINI